MKQTLLSRSDITKFNILSARVLTIEGRLSVATVVNILVAVDVQVMSLDDRMAVEQVVFIQA